MSRELAGVSMTPAPFSTPTQCLGVMPKVVIDETRDEIAAVVIARVTSQRQRMSCRGGGTLERLGLELLGQEVVVLSLVDQQRQTFARVGNEFARIPVLPALTIRPEIPPPTP